MDSMIQRHLGLEVTVPLEKSLVEETTGCGTATSSSP